MITSFEENKYYVMTGKGENWSDYDGPFDSPAGACHFLKKLCGAWASPEALSATVVEFKEGRLDLFKCDNNNPVNGNSVFWSNTVYHKGVIILEPSHG